MIGIASVTYDADGNRVFSSPSRAEYNVRGTRRVSRTATLDGGVVVSDFGYSDGDRDLSVVEDGASAEAIAFAKNVVENFPLVTIANFDGAYLAVPDGWSLSKGSLTLKFLIVERISE